MKVLKHDKTYLCHRCRDLTVTKVTPANCGTCGEPMTTDNVEMFKNEKFKELITFLDCALTNKPYSDCIHTFICVPHSPEELIGGDLYYLSDSGYSRLYWDKWNDRGILVASESLDRVKEAVGRCKELIEDLNTFLFSISLKK